MEQGPMRGRLEAGQVDIPPLTCTLTSLVILPAPQEPLPGPTGSPAIRSQEAQSLHCLQPFSTQDTWGQPFHARAQEALDVLLRHPSGGPGWESGDTPFCPLGRQWASGTKTPPALILGTGWWLVANEDQQMAWFPAPYLEEVALGQGRDGEWSLGSSGETNPPPHTHHHGAVFGKAESQEARKPGE